MARESLVWILVLLTILSGGSPFFLSFQGAEASPSMLQSSLISDIDGHQIYLHDVELEDLTRSHLAYRSAGSVGANLTADWTLNKFKEAGVEAWKEGFEFASWDLRSKAFLRIDRDGDLATNDSIEMSTFGSEQWSWSTGAEGMEGEALLLPLPEAGSKAMIGVNPIKAGEWDLIDATGKVLFLGREVRWDPSWQEALLQKIEHQRPAAVVLIWWYDWMKSLDLSFYSSSGGLPLGALGPYFWKNHIPVGHLNFSESALIKSTLSSQSSKALIKIDSSYGMGIHDNIVGRINGSEQDSLIVVGAHYDSVLDPGFGDNGGGLAALIEIAKVLADAQRAGAFSPKCTLLLVAFAGEELGMVGSGEFVRSHLTEMEDIKAVINLDCLGSRQLRVSSDESSLDLANTILKAASDIKVDIAPVGEEVSDHQAFRSPSIIDRQIYRSWGVELNISQATPVTASVSLLSSPITYDDPSIEGRAGWIHTDRDSYSTKDWILEEDLANHTKVALLSILIVSEGSAASFPIWPIVVASLAILAVVSLAISSRRRRGV